jgi:GH24 family phage-related lysozyme (muramidase)
MTITDFSFLDPSIDHRLAIDLDAAEANRLEAYPDTLGNWTVGRGHLLPPAAPGRSWAGFTVIPSTSDRFFNGDILNAIKLAQRWPEYPACDTACRKNALYELAFNMAHKFESWGQTIALIKEQNWQGVHDHLLGSLWAKQVQPHGIWRDGTDANGSPVREELPGRATRIADYFLTGEYPT